MEIRKFYYELCRRVDSPISLGMWLRFSMAPNELAEASIDPMDYTDLRGFARDYACVSFLKKFRGLDTGTDLRAAALLRFGESEKQCEIMNGLLDIARVTGRLDRTENRYLHRVQEIIANIWGTPSFHQLFDRCGWGPGATSTLKGESASREDKMSQFPVSLTPCAEPYFDAVVKDRIQWLRHLLKQDVVGPTSLLPACYQHTSWSRVLTVPKNASTDRTIAAEPTGNIFLQKGIGGYLRSRLKRFGINLDSQELNQLLAKRALFEGLSTLDLSAASDTVSIGVVKLLCPPSMFDVLNRLRSPTYRLDGAEANFHKFSSMGNGFTFELESVIFYAAVKAVMDITNTEGPIGVYGDDIICPQGHITDEVILLLNDLGFTVNKTKSFTDGAFYESCGKHYFLGVDVTPPYQKEIVDCEIEEIRCINRFTDWVQRLSDDFMDCDDLWKVHIAGLRLLSPGLIRQNVYGPLWAEGDGFIKVRTPNLKYCLRRRGYQLRYLKTVPGRKRLGDGGYYADYLSSFLSDIPTDQPASHGYMTLRPRGRVKRASKASRWIYRW